MANEMDDLEFLLPAELLTDDDFLTDFGYGPESSDLSSPVESVTGAPETGAGADDFISELTRKLTNSSLSHGYPVKSVKRSGSPQSTLSGLKTGSTGSPNSDSRVFSPPEVKDSLTWDMVYAAVEEAARVRLVEEAAAFYTSELLGPARKPNPTTGFYSGQAHNHPQYSYQQLQAAKVRQNRVMMQNVVFGPDYFIQSGMRDGGGAYGLSMSSWPTLQQSRQQTGSGMKSVFPGEPAPVKERVGTGVFMPRNFISNPTEPRKKPVHGLNTSDYDAVLKLRNDLKIAQNQVRNQQIRASPLLKQEVTLPQEWTY